MTRRGPGEGSIYPRKDGRWAGSVHIGYEDGKRVRKHVMGRTRNEVKDKLAVVMRAHEEKRPIPDQRAKLGPFLRRWLDEVAKPTLRPSTYRSYDSILKIHLVPCLGHIALARLTPADVQAFLNGRSTKGLSPRRVQYIHAVLRRALGTAERWGMVSRNVAKLVEVPRVLHREMTPLTPEQARALIEASVADRHRALWITALGTGLRQGELLALRWEDVGLDAGVLRVRHSLANVGGVLTLQEPKTDRSRRTVVLPDSVVAALRAHRTRQLMDRLAAGARWVDTGHVFTTMIGRPHHAATITRAFADALNRAGLPRVRFHDLRHSAATFLLAQGMTLEDVKQLLGHSSITLTSNTYGHLLEQRQRQVAQAMDAVLGG
ncbi:MAG TPA: site-specific integrase [Candidatus Limnocylindrales bacterium]|jgi:integrase|nr:site-specific integrase [Candidatus Limnocylindrales bacterium]